MSGRYHLWQLQNIQGLQCKYDRAVLCVMCNPVNVSSGKMTWSSGWSFCQMCFFGMELETRKATVSKRLCARFLFEWSRWNWPPVNDKSGAYVHHCSGHCRSMVICFTWHKFKKKKKTFESKRLVFGWCRNNLPVWLAVRHNVEKYCKKNPSGSGDIQVACFDLQLSWEQVSVPGYLPNLLDLDFVKRRQLANWTELHGPLCWALQKIFFFFPVCADCARWSEPCYVHLMFGPKMILKDGLPSCVWIQSGTVGRWITS